jgi:hypothetical protein
MLTMSTFSDVTPLVGGIVEEFIHLPCSFKPHTLWVKSEALNFARVKHRRLHRHFALGGVAFGVSILHHLTSMRVRGRRIGVDVWRGGSGNLVV